MSLKDKSLDEMFIEIIIEPQEVVDEIQALKDFYIARGTTLEKQVAFTRLYSETMIEMLENRLPCECPNCRGTAFGPKIPDTIN